MRRTYSTMTAAQLALWRQQRGLSLREASAELGVGWRTLSWYLSGKRDIPLTVARLAWALTCIDTLQYRLAKYEGPPRNLTATEREQLAKAAVITAQIVETAGCRRQQVLALGKTAEVVRPFTLDFSRRKRP